MKNPNAYFDKMVQRYTDELLNIRPVAENRAPHMASPQLNSDTAESFTENPVQQIVYDAPSPEHPIVANIVNPAPMDAAPQAVIAIDPMVVIPVLTSSPLSSPATQCFDASLNALNTCAPFTDSFGRPILNDNNSLTVGESGPVLLEDIYLIEKLAHFDRERIPERVVHAKGAGAFGDFICKNDMSKYTSASVFSKTGTSTPVFTRFSTVIGSKGSADTARDPRGFAVKFYTQQGNLDIVGNNIPVFFIRDAIKFPDIIHSLKPSPQNNIRNPERFWDFISLTPESTHMIVWLYSDFGTFKSFRNMDGFGVNTYVWVNETGARHLIKYHWKTLQGLKPIQRAEADALAGIDPDIAVSDLSNAICQKDFPKYDLFVQVMTENEAAMQTFDPLDDTKVWDEEKFPLIMVGTMELNRNPENFFAQTEQSAFCPSNLVPGVELSNDKMLQGRSFSYADTQRYRLGTNFSTLPINAPIVPVNNTQRDGDATYIFDKNPINYHPNSLNNNCPTVPDYGIMPIGNASGRVIRATIAKTDDFGQAGEKFNSYTMEQKDRLCDNIAIELAFCNNDIVDRVLNNFNKACPKFAMLVREKIQNYRKA